MPSKYLIGLTGGIGSGKSLASSHLIELGYKVIQADSLTHRLYNNNPILKNELIRNFGEGIYDKKSGKFKPSKAREIFFMSSHTLKKVNHIVHPYVIEEIRKNVSKITKGLIFVESALLFETSYYMDFDYTTLIYSHKYLRLQRVIKRDGLTRREVLKLMSFQMNEKDKLKLADFVIYNNSGKKHFLLSIENFALLLESMLL